MNNTKRRFASFIITITAVSSLTMFIIFYLVNKNKYFEFVSEYTKKMVHASMADVDRRIEKDIYRFIDQNLFKYENQNQIARFFNTQGDSMSFLGEINVQLYELRKTNPRLSELILFRTYDQAIISDRRGRYLSSINKELEKNKINDILNIFDLFFFNEYGKNVKTLESSNETVAFLFPYLANTPEQEVLGYIILYANKSNLFDVEMVIDNPQGSFLVMDEQKNIIYSKGNNIFSNEMWIVNTYLDSFFKVM